MFRKIVSNLPYNPAILDQVGFYAARLRQENSIRRLGLLFTAMVIVLQLFVIISPSKPSLATSANDIIYGARSKDEVLKAYNNNADSLGRKDIQAIFNHYGIGSAQISASTYQRIGSQQKKFISTGRGTSPGVDTFIAISGAQNGGIYQRFLSSWDTNGRQNWYNSITGISTYGFRFWILTSGCGNIVFEDGSLNPNLNIVKQSISGSVAKPGDSIKYQIQFQNIGPGTAKNVVIKDILSEDYSFVDYSSNIDLKFSRSGQTLSWTIANVNSELPSGQRWYNIELSLKVKDSIVTNKRLCNSASIGANGIAAINSTNNEDYRCINVTIPVCPGTGLPIPPSGVEACQVTCPDGSVVAYNQQCAQPQLSCHYLKIVSSSTWDSRKFETAIISQSGAIPKQINYYVNSVKVASLPFIAGSSSQFYTHKFSGAGTYIIKADLEASLGTIQPNQSCQIAETIVEPKQPQARIFTDKQVTNVTKNIEDANGTTASAGDTLKYTISITNSGDAEYDNLKLEGEYGESVGDVLEYSDFTDTGDAHYDNQTRFLSWDAVDIPAGTTIKKSFSVKVKDPLPATPISASDPLSFDFNMQNKYGKQVVIHLPKPVTKIIEQTAKELPNTGPGTNIAIITIVAIISGYFFYRGKLLSRELAIVHHSYSAGGL